MINVQVVLSQAHALEAAHPAVWTVLDTLLSAFGGAAALPYVKAKGVAWVIDKAADWQEAQERKRGLTPEQMAILAAHEARVAQQAADELKKRAAALVPPVTLPPVGIPAPPSA